MWEHLAMKSVRKMDQSQSLLPLWSDVVLVPFEFRPRGTQEMLKLKNLRKNMITYQGELQTLSARTLATSRRFKSYRSGRSRIILRARSVSMTFFLSGNSSCIIFAVVRSTLLLLHFLLHSLFFRSYLVSLQYFDDFYHIRQ